VKSPSDRFDLILVGIPQVWQMGGVGPLYLQVCGVCGFMGNAPDFSNAVEIRRGLRGARRIRVRGLNHRR
jgi:hypothetical protein